VLRAGALADGEHGEHPERRTPTKLTQHV